MLTRALTIVVLATVFLGGCSDGTQQVKVGAKNFAESRILAEMMAVLAEKQGLQVAGVVDYPNTQAILEALRRGDIDVYPDYNGTGLVMLGQNPMADGDEATARVKQLYEPLGLTWLGRFGFANNYGLAVRAQYASEMGLSKMSDLVASAPEMSIAIEDDFESRPLDGMTPMLARYGMQFNDTKVVPLGERGTLYDQLIDGDVDVIEVYTTDGQIADYDLVVLEDDLVFFPVYQAAPLARASSLADHSGLGGALETLAGKIDADTMRELNGRVEIGGRSPRAVARDALARIGLIDSGAVTTEEPLLIAAEAPLADTSAEATALRAASKAFRGQDLEIATVVTPLKSVSDGDARLALVGAEAFFDLSKPAPESLPGYEAVAAVGETLLHIVAPKNGGVASIANAKTMAVGPEGSSSARIADILTSGLGLEGAVVNVEGGGSQALIEAVRSGSADVAVIMTVAGDAAVDEAFSGLDLKLLPPAGWKEGANLVRFPFLREARLAASTYQGQFSPVDTLRTQLVIAGPAEAAGDALGDQGPSVIAAGVSPISGAAVKALNAAIPGDLRVDPVLPMAAALAPELPQAPAAMNPAADISILNLLVVIGLVWIFWLYGRPKYR